MPGTQDANATKPANTTYADMANVFDELMNKEGTQNAEDPTTEENAGAANTASDAEQQTDTATGTGDSAQHAAAAGDGASDDGEGKQAGAGDDTTGGNQADQGVADASAARIAELEAQLAAARATQPAPAAAAEHTPTTPEEPAVFTADETAELTTLKEQWPDLHRLFELMGRQLQVDTLKYAFSEVGRVIAPLQETVNTYTTSDHKAALYDAHSDYDEVFQPTMDWIEQQPSFLKQAYLNVVKQGTADEVSMMIQKFKDETGWTSAAKATGTTPATPKAAASASTQQQAGLSEAAKKAAKAMGAVGAKRGGAAAGQDPNDFNQGWEDAINTPAT